jgi:hypothetical protein
MKMAPERWVSIETVSILLGHGDGHVHAPGSMSFEFGDGGNRAAGI